MLKYYNLTCISSYDTILSNALIEKLAQEALESCWLLQNSSGMCEKSLRSSIPEIF